MRCKGFDGQEDSAGRSSRARKRPRQELEGFFIPHRVIRRARVKVFVSCSFCTFNVSVPIHLQLSQEIDLRSDTAT